jgi:hypothetical protein
VEEIMRPSERDHVRDVALPAIRDAAGRSLLQSLFDAVDRCESAGTCPADVLEQIDAALRSRSEIIRSRAAAWLHRLASQHPPAADRLRHLFTTGPCTSRLSLVQSIAFDGVSNEPLEREILAAALRDQVSRIRGFAADRIRMRGWRDMGPAIDAAAATMPTASGRDGLMRCRRLLVDGFDVCPRKANDDRIQMIVQFRGGMATLSVPPSVIEALGHAEVARRARLRSDWPRPAPTPPGESWDPVPDPTDLSKNAGLDPDLVAARSAFAEFEAASSAAVNTLLTVLQGTSPDARKCAAAWLARMSASVAEVDPTILGGFDEWSDAARLAIVQAIHVYDSLPKELVIDVVRHALRDPRPLIRRMAGLQVQYRELDELLAALIKAAAADPDPETAASLAENVAFLRDGYVATPLPRKRYEVRVAIGHGVQVFQVPAKIAEEIGFPEIARRVRARRQRKGRRLPGKFWDPI